MRGRESLEGKELRVIFVLSDVWECFQNLKREMKEPEMMDDNMMREIFNMAGIKI